MVLISLWMVRGGVLSVLEEGGVGIGDDGNGSGIWWFWDGCNRRLREVQEGELVLRVVMVV